MVNPMKAGKDERADVVEKDKNGIKKGSALRWKYRVTAGTVTEDGEPQAKRFRLNPNQIGWHPSNRNGKGPQASRCQQLCADLLGKWDPEQANHFAVAIQCNPNDKERFLTHTTKVCNNACLAAPKPSALAPMVGAAVGHSHLNQLLRNITNGACADSPRLTSRVCVDGCISMKKVDAIDPRMAHQASAGITWEMLNYQLEEEEGADGVACVQMSLNDGHACAMAVYEMQGLAHTEYVILQSIQVRDIQAPAGETQTFQLSVAKVATWKEEVSAAGFADLAMSPYFHEVCSLVASTCQGPWLKRMHDFHTQFINSKLRRLPYATLGGLCYIPLDRPRDRHALFEYAWNKKDGDESIVCTTVKGPALKALAQAKYGPLLAETEALLKEIQVDYQNYGLYTEIQKKALVFDQLMTHVNIVVAEALLAGAVEKVQKAVARLPREVYNLLHKYLGGRGHLQNLLPPGAKVLSGLAQVDQDKPAHKTPLPGPAILGYDANGMPLQNAQPTLAQPRPKKVELKWRETLKNVNTETVFKARAFHAYSEAQSLVPKDKDNVIILGQEDGKGDLEVRANKDFKPHELIIIPHVMDINAFSLKKTLGKTPGVLLKAKASDGKPYYLNPSIKTTGQNPFVAPFWAIRRTNVDVEANVEIVEDAKKNSILTLSVHGTETDSSDVQYTQVPIISNSKEIQVDEELVLYVPKEAANNKTKYACWDGQTSSR